MERRKIQLIAGTTYSVSLPKKWIKKNKLKEQDELIISEKNDKTLSILSASEEIGEISEITLNIDDYMENIDQILFAVYYLGIETINIVSKNALKKEDKKKIRKTLTHMSGTEISYEDKQKMTIKVLLDISKTDIKQILYRLYLIIESSIMSMIEKIDIKEIKMNENEIDRLYHLLTKIISVSLINSDILHSSKIKNVSLIPSYFLIAKRLENIGDDINHLSDYIYGKKRSLANNKKILNFIKNEINKAIDCLLMERPKKFIKTSKEKILEMKKIITEMENKIISKYFEDMIRYVTDIQEEVVNISFYKKLISENKL